MRDLSLFVDALVDD